MLDNELNRVDIQQRGYEKYLGAKRNELARPLGANVLLALTTVGLTETPMPNFGEYEIKSPEYTNDKFEVYTRPLGERGLAEVIQLDSHRSHRPTPRLAIQHFEELEDLGQPA